MKSYSMPETELLGDAELVELCRQGDREVFGEIVARYQSVVCALALSACGNMSRSEDLAQEVFISAWRNLPKLKEPACLKQWLCGIARNTINYSYRQGTRDPITRSEPWEEELEDWTEPSTPPDQAMSNEEAAILWRVLDNLPRAYREPMVLFYRQEESITAVAEALELTEENVRQRLSRGRAMLNERIAKLVESGLRRSAPSKGFILGVMGALPLAATQTSAAGVMTAVAAKTTSTIKAGGLLGTIISTIPSALSVLAAVVTLWGRVVNTQSPRERRFALITTLGFMAWGVVLTLTALYFVRAHTPQVLTYFSDAIAVAWVWLFFCGPLDGYAIWVGRVQRQIRLEQNPQAGLPAFGALHPGRKGFNATMYGALGALFCGTSGWLVAIAYFSRQYAVCAILATVVLCSWFVSAQTAVRHPKSMKAVFTSVAWGLLLFILAVVNLFWESWSMSAPFSGFPKSPAPAGVNLLIVVVFASIRIGWFLKEHMVPAPKLRPWIIWSVVGYFAVLLLGAGGYTAARLVEGPRPMATQTTVCNILPEGTIQFTTTDETPYTGKAPLDKFYFANSDFVHVDRLMDKDGRPLAFTTRHEDSTSTYYYSGKLNDPIQPGTVIGLKMEGSMTGRISTNAPDTYSFREQHWPANGIRTRRIEVYRLPPGAQLLQSKPPAATRVLPDGRIELRFDKHIPPGGNISVEFDYRLLKDDQKN